jgi:amidohydrolase
VREAGPLTIALRADIDGLKMPENNPQLAYCSKTEYAHMCGHDGHTATLVLAAVLLMRERERLPANCTVRLLFQPAEEGPGGAKPMVEAGCLEGVDEVFGLHNVPNFPEGEIRVKEGPLMASISGIKVTIKGKGGHSSMPNHVKDVISAGASIVNNFH